jgi:outer membrane protein
MVSYIRSPDNRTVAVENKEMNMQDNERVIPGRHRPLPPGKRIRAIAGLPFFLCAAALCLSTSAHAQSAGSIVLSTGWLRVAPQVRTDPMMSTVSLGGHHFHKTNAGMSAQGSPANTLGLTATYFLTDHIATEWVMGIPPTFRINGAGTAQSYGELGSAKMWSPTVLLKYYFGKANAKFRPFVGLGATYIWFTDGKISNNAFATQVLGGNTSVSVSKGLSPVFNAGANYEFAKNWYAGLSVSFIPAHRMLTLTTPTAATQRGTASITSTVPAQLNPIVTYVNIGYRF